MKIFSLLSTVASQLIIPRMQSLPGNLTHHLRTTHALAKLKQRFYKCFILPKSWSSFLTHFLMLQKVARVHVRATNALSWIEMSTAPSSTAAPRKKRGQSLRATNRQPGHRQRATTLRSAIQPFAKTSPRQEKVTGNEKILINYILIGKIWDKETTPLDPQFIF
jgi:hypothetical protein